jgi:T3SS (YopN, CesT) and YbjN peptide-binding chaperone 1/T3SS (YopN, CesT) and YbjN peptide-binding chaperone 3
MADIDDFDLDRSTAQAWAEFQSRLSEVISVIDDSADLTIDTVSEGSGPPPFVRLSSPRPGVVRCEAASNAVLGDDFQLSAELLAAMERLGWQPPAIGNEQASEAQSARPTANFWIELPQIESDRISELAVSALRDIYGVQHPVFLAPDQLAEALQPVQAPSEADASTKVLHEERNDLEPTMPRDQQHLNDLVDAELAEIYGYPPIRDVDGDVAVRVGSTMLFLRTSRDGKEVVLFAPVVHDVAGRSRAAEVLNDLNVEARWVKFQLIKDRVFVTISVLSQPFVPAHLRQAVRILSDVADGIDNELAAKLNGRTTFSDRDESR